MPHCSPNGMDDKRHYVQIKSNSPKSDYDWKGKYHWYKYQWKMNHYTWTMQKPEVIDFLEITEEQWVDYEKQFTHRYNPENETWYDI